MLGFINKHYLGEPMKKQKTNFKQRTTRPTEAVLLSCGLGADDKLSDKLLNILLTMQRLRIKSDRAKLKLKAFQKLVATDFTLDENATEWKTIDEKPEYFLDIRGKKLIESLFLRHNFPSPSELYNQNYPKES